MSASCRKSTAELVQVFEFRSSRARISRDGDVVVAEHDIGTLEPSEQRSQVRLATRVRDEVTGDGDEVGSTALDPGHGTFGRELPA